MLASACDSHPVEAVLSEGSLHGASLPAAAVDSNVAETRTASKGLHGELALAERVLPMRPPEEREVLRVSTFACRDESGWGHLGLSARTASHTVALPLQGIEVVGEHVAVGTVMPSGELHQGEKETTVTVVKCGRLVEEVDSQLPLQTRLIDYVLLPGRGPVREPLQSSRVVEGVHNGSGTID